MPTALRPISSATETSAILIRLADRTCTEGLSACDALKPSADHPRETVRDPQQDCDNNYPLQH